MISGVDQDSAPLADGPAMSPADGPVARRSLARAFAEPARTLRDTSDWLRGRWELRKCTAVGAWTRVNGRVHVVNQGEMVIGSRVQILSRFGPCLLVTFPDGRLEIGNGTMLNFGADISSTRSVKIGSNCLIGTHVIILDNDFHGLADRLRMPAPRPVNIGNRVWIGNRVIVLPGVTIGDGSAVGAGSVVTSDVPPNSVVVGNPARLVRHL